MSLPGMQPNPVMGAFAVPLREIELFARTVVVSSSVSISASAREGDVGVMFDAGGALASGWELLKSNSDYFWSYKILEAADIGASITTLSGTKMLHIIRGDRRIRTVSVPEAWEGQITDGNPSAQHPQAGSYAGPLAVFGMCGRGTGSASVVFSTDSPAFDDEVLQGTLRTGYKLYNLADPTSDHTIDVNDLGLANKLQSGFLLFR